MTTQAYHHIIKIAITTVAVMTQSTPQGQDSRHNWVTMTTTMIPQHKSVPSPQLKHLPLLASPLTTRLPLTERQES